MNNFRNGFLIILVCSCCSACEQQCNSSIPPTSEYEDPRTPAQLKVWRERYGPRFVDSDGDGYDDGYEVSMGKKPLDARSNPGSAPFIITIEIESNEGQFTMGTVPKQSFNRQSYNYNIDCESDGLPDAIGVTEDYTCAFSAPGRYKISVFDNTGTRDGFPQLKFLDSDREKIVEINQWGTGKWTSFEEAFIGCTNLSNEREARDVPDLSIVEDLDLMFYGSSFNQNIGNWNTKNVRSMMGMFAESQFNKEIGKWDTGRVASLASMFCKSAFNQDISMWDTSNVVDMNYTFAGASKFNQDIGQWDTSDVTHMNGMFYEASTFNQDIGKWDTRRALYMADMFKGASAFFIPNLNRTHLLQLLTLGSGWSFLTPPKNRGFLGASNLFRTDREWVRFIDPKLAIDDRLLESVDELVTLSDRVRYERGQIDRSRYLSCSPYPQLIN